MIRTQWCITRNLSHKLFLQCYLCCIKCVVKNVNEESFEWHSLILVKMVRIVLNCELTGPPAATNKLFCRPQPSKICPPPGRSQGWGNVKTLPYVVFVNSAHTVQTHVAHKGVTRRYGLAVPLLSESNERWCVPLPSKRPNTVPDKDTGPLPCRHFANTWRRLWGIQKLLLGCKTE
jgi:hypothetical protein